MDIEIDPLETIPEKFGPVRVRVYGRESEDGAANVKPLDDLDTAVAFVRDEAVRGSPRAQVCWAHMLLSGHGVSSDRDAAFRWFQIAARSGEPDALNMLGRCYELGWGVASSASVAAHYYRNAAGKNDAWAQFNLASLLMHGNGVHQDYREALSLLVRSARQRNSKAMNMIGRFREEGWAGRVKPSAAVWWYRRAAERGCFRGQFHLSRFLYAAGQIDNAAKWLSASLSSAPQDFCREIVDAYSDHPDDRIRQVVRASADQS